MVDASSPFGLFKTDDARELEGTKIDYGAFWFHVARAGGANKRYGRILADRLRPHRRAIQTETINEDLARKLAIETFAEGCVLNWGSTKFGDGQMVNEDGTALPYSNANVVGVLMKLPELFQDLREQAEQIANFRNTEMENDAGN